MSRNQKVKRELKALLIDNNETLPTLSSVEGNNIAERLKQRRRGMSISQIEIKRVELENPFLPKKSRRGAKRKRNEFIERLEEEREPQIMQQEQEITTEKNDPVWEPWDEVTPTRHIRKLKGNVVSVVIEPKDVSETSTREKRRRLQSLKETQEDKKELDAVASLLAMANGKKVLRMMTPERAAENLIDGASLKTPEPISRDLVSLNVVPKQIKRGPKNVDYGIADLTIVSGSSQSVPVQDVLTRSERTFEDNATQKRRTRAKKMSADVPSSLNVKAFPSYTEIKYAKELQNLDHHITRYFNKWEIELNSNINVLLYGFGSKEHILETYQAFDNKNENVTWIHFDGSGDLTDMNDAYLMLLDKILGPNHIFKNHTLIGKALAIRGYYNDVVSRIKFKIIVSIS
jgi:hypothetical protein